MSDKASVSLVLGSGGARGLAHIGIIEWLEENGFEIRSIAGSSMGALVGGIYAAGELDTYARWVSTLERMDVVRLLDFSFRGDGLFKGERVMEVLRELIGDRRIEDLPLSFTAVATDLERQKEFWLTRGSLFQALRASIAIPTVFTPARVHGRTLVDGGLVNPMPIAPTLRDPTEWTIAVNLSGPPLTERQLENHSALTEDKEGADEGYRKQIAAFVDSVQRRMSGNAGGRKEEDVGRKARQDIFDLVSQSLETVQNTIARFQLAAYAPDIIIDVPRNACSFYEFHRARQMIRLGRERAEAVLGGDRDPRAGFPGTLRRS